MGGGVRPERCGGRDGAILMGSIGLFGIKVQMIFFLKKSSECNADCVPLSAMLLYQYDAI
jgi:hypothetical protein